MDDAVAFPFLDLALQGAFVPAVCHIAAPPNHGAISIVDKVGQVLGSCCPILGHLVVPGACFRPLGDG